MKKEIALQEFLNFINNINTDIIFTTSTNKIKYTIKNIITSKDKAHAVYQFYNDIALLSNYLRKITQSKKLQILIKKQELEKVLEHIENIDDEGNFIHPINEKTIDELISEFEKQFKQNQKEYKINDIIISRYKTQRIYSLLIKYFTEIKKEELLLFSLTYNSLLSHEEYESINKC